MGIEISISCSTHRCRSTMSENDEVYCADCMSAAAQETKEKETQLENRDEEISNLETELSQANDTIVQLKEIIKACTTCSAILVAKNL
jgi:predicted RNase H-like nuclease (RuvC/YqgF family)